MRLAAGDAGSRVDVKRPPLIIVVCLLLGGVVNVAWAWGASIWEESQQPVAYQAIP